MTIQSLKPEHWPRVREIYLEGIASGDATFETEAPDWDAWTRTHHHFARLIATNGDDLSGWAALSPVSARNAYRGVAEVSVYVAAAARGKGYGRSLLHALVAESENHGIWTLQASVFPENTASLRLHASFDFREVGRRERIAQLHGVWRSTVLLERRSKLVGND